MKILQNIILSISLVISTLTFAQNDIKARIEFEEAEKQFNENNFSEAVKYLENTEELMGKWIPKVSFMKIESLNKIADLNDLESENSKKLIQEVKQYMDYYSLHKEDVIMEKFKIVYAIDGNIKQLIKQSSEVKSPEYLAGLKAFEEKNYAVTMDLWTKSAATGNSTAMYGIGCLYVNGEGVSKDQIKAVEWFQKSAAGGNGNGMITLASLYFHGQEGIAKDYKKAMEWYLKAANKADDEAMHMVGYGYLYGKGLPEDNSKAMEWFQKSADKGNTEAMYWLGYGCFFGDGVTKDTKKAMEWLQKSADRGDTMAMGLLGHAYFYGEDVAKDSKKAMEWSLKAGEAVNGKAFYIVGSLYQKGEGVTKDYAKALEYHLKASEKGYEDSIREMAVIYNEGGYGVKRDKKKATELRAEYEAKKK